MKHLALSLFVFNLDLLYAAVPLKWTVETSRVQPVVFDAVRGETLALEASFNSYGTPLQLPANASLFYQTNGMGSAWWTIPATVSATNRISATFAPTNDPGAASVVGFLGTTGEIYRAAFTLRFRHGPGATPNALPIPTVNYDVALVGEPTINGTNLTDFVDNRAEKVIHSYDATNLIDRIEEASGTASSAYSLATEAMEAASNAVQSDGGEASNLTISEDTIISGTVDSSEATSVKLPSASAIEIGDYTLAEYLRDLDNWNTNPNAGNRAVTSSQVSNAYRRKSDLATYNSNGELTDDYICTTNAANGLISSALAGITASSIGARELTNNVCAADWFSPWIATLPAAPSGDWEIQPTFDTDNSEWRWYYTDWYAESGNSDPNATSVTFSFTVEGATTTFPATRTRVAISNDTFTTYTFVTNSITTSLSSATNGITASSIGAYPAASGQQLANSVSSISGYLNAEDAHFVSTNYDSSARLPEAYVEVKIDGTWLTIWKEMRRWTAFVGSAFSWDSWGGFYAWGTNVTANISSLWNTKADRCWGIYDSETGGYSPEGYTQISSSNILIAANMAYQRTVTSGGNVWVLQCNTGTAHIGGDTNGFFRILDGDGNVQFEIIKGSKRELGADADGITVDNSTTPPTCTIPYSVVAATHPTIYVCNDLATANWKDEDDSDCVANVTWTGASGAWVASVQAKTAPAPKLFVKATYESGGETYIRNVAPVGMSSIYLNGTKYYLGTATIDGHTVLTLSTTAQ